MDTPTIYLIIHNVRSAHNVGSLLRTADGLGVTKVFLTGYTGSPIDRFGRKDSKIAKVSLGAEDSVPWEKRDVIELITELKQNHVAIVVLEQAPHAIPLHDYHPRGASALVVGNEVDGVSSEVLELADTVVEIPMRGEKESLNVSNAGAIALYQLSAHSSQ